VHIYLFSQVDTQLETGEYFLKAREKEARETQRRKQQVRSFLHYQCLISLICSVSKQLETTAKQKEKRAEVFVAPAEKAQITVEERLKRKRSAVAGLNEGEIVTNLELEKRKKKRKHRHEGD